VRGKAAEQLGVVVGNTLVSFTLDRLQQKSRPGQGKVRARLQLTIAHWHGVAGFPRIWHDDESRPLEQQIPEIVIGLVVAGEMFYRETVIQNHQWLRERKKEREDQIRKAQEQRERTQ